MNLKYIGKKYRNDSSFFKGSLFLLLAVKEIIVVRKL